MAVIYGVYRNGGAWEDRYHHLEKCFKTIQAASEFMEMLVLNEESERAMAEKCSNCAGIDKGCPLFVECFDDSEECMNYYELPNRDKETFEIKEIHYEDK